MTASESKRCCDFLKFNFFYILGKIRFSTVRINVITKYTAAARWLEFFHACSPKEDDDVQTRRKHVSELDTPAYSHMSDLTDFENTVLLTYISLKTATNSALQHSS